MTEEERTETREIDIDVSLDSNEFIDLKEVYELIRNDVERKSWRLIEDIADRLISIIAERFKPDKIIIEVRKPTPPIGGKVDYVSCRLIYQK